MKAVYINRYGSTDVLEYGDRPDPVPGANEVLIEVHAVGVNPRDWLLQEGKYVFKFLVPGFPLILGSDISGVVTEVGKRVKKFKAGDEIYAMQTPLGGMGGYAEYISIKESAVAFKPKNMTYEEAAAVPVAGITAWQGLIKDAKMKSGDHVLVIGASGGVGTYAVQIAKAYKAKVTGVCSTTNIELVKKLGADSVIDYKKEKFNEILKDFDIVFDTIGRESLKSCSKVLRPRGIYITTIPNFQNALDSISSQIQRKIIKNRKKSLIVTVRSSGKRLTEIAKLSETGKLISVIDTVYPIRNTAEAHIKSRTFRTKGKLVLKVR